MSSSSSETVTISRALGINMAEYLKSMPMELDIAVLTAAIAETYAGKPPMSEEDYRNGMNLCQNRMKEEAGKLAGEAAKANIAAGAEFLKNNAAKAGVKSTPSGLQYEVIAEGSGRKPVAADQVRVHYVGTLLDGTVFDSSVARGEPAEFGLDQVIAGWTEGLQLMSKGAKYRFTIPADLAYGERGAGNVIGPHSTLIFDVELLEIL
ncbi:MAG: FKBP-type peptidyl-prolyl cis-trans isomerase [Victivallaceae bacterium]